MGTWLLLVTRVETLAVLLAAFDSAVRLVTSTVLTRVPATLGRTTRLRLSLWPTPKAPREQITLPAASEQ